MKNDPSLKNSIKNEDAEGTLSRAKTSIINACITTLTKHKKNHEVSKIDSEKIDIQIKKLQDIRKKENPETLPLLDK